MSSRTASRSGSWVAGLVGEQLEQRLQRGERRAQLVRGGGDERPPRGLLVARRSCSSPNARASSPTSSRWESGGNRRVELGAAHGLRSARSRRSSAAAERQPPASASAVRLRPRPRTPPRRRSTSARRRRGACAARARRLAVDLHRYGGPCDVALDVVLRAPRDEHLVGVGEVAGRERVGVVDHAALGQQHDLPPRCLRARSRTVMCVVRMRVLERRPLGLRAQHQRVRGVAAQPRLSGGSSASAATASGRRRSRRARGRSGPGAELHGSQPIPRSADRQDQLRPLGRGLELLAQVADVDVDPARVAIRASRPRSPASAPGG